ERIRCGCLQRHAERVIVAEHQAIRKARIDKRFDLRIALVPRQGSRGLQWRTRWRRTAARQLVHPYVITTTNKSGLVVGWAVVGVPDADLGRCEPFLLEDHRLLFADALRARRVRGDRQAS